MEEFIYNFAKIFDDIEVSSITPHTMFRELEDWDSIAGLSLIAMADEEYDVTLNAEDMRKCQTVEDLYKTVVNKK